MAELKLVNVSKKYPGNIAAVQETNIEVAEKEFLTIVGPSGCGKSTTLRMICGLERVSTGQIIIGGEDVTHLPPRDRDIAMVFQNYALYPHITVYENMAFSLKIRNHPKAEIEKRVNSVANLLGIKDLLKRYPSELSGGEMQRVAVGRAVVRKPRIFLFDEPLSNLDANFRVEMRSEIRRLHNKLEVTTIYVTHDQIEAMTMGDRIAVMKDGIIHQHGNPFEVYSEPANQFVGGFIGSPPMNFIRCRVSANGNNWYLDEGSFQLNMPTSRIDTLKSYLGEEILLGIRPEDIYDKLFVSNISGGENTVTMICDFVENMGSEAFLHLSTNRHKIIARVDSYTNPAINQDMELVVDVNKAKFFDKSTGEKIS